MGRLAKKTRDAYINAAKLAVQHYTACIAMHDDAPVVKFNKQHLDPALPATPGYLVQAWVFVSAEDLDNEQED